MWFEEKDWQRAYKSETLGTFKLGIEIKIHIPRNLDREDQEVFYKAAQMIEEALNKRTMELNPETAIKKSKQRKEMYDVFNTAGIAPIYMEEITNEYCGRACCLDRPWYIVATPIGQIKIGWRKRVIHLEWQERLNLDGNEIFKDQKIGNVDITRGQNFIHCYGYEKAIEYLIRLRNEFKKEGGERTV